MLPKTCMSVSLRVWRLYRHNLACPSQTLDESNQLFKQDTYPDEILVAISETTYLYTILLLPYYLY